MTDRHTVGWVQPITRHDAVPGVMGFTHPTSLPITRRSAILGTTAALFAPAIVRAQSGPVKLGIVYAKQGTFAELGTSAANGALLTLEQAGGKVLGRPVQTIWLDEPNPQSAQQNMQKLIEEEHVSAVLGGISGATALALGSLAKRSKIPLITTSGATTLTGKDCNRFVFRANAPATVAVRALAPLLLERGKKWFFLMPDYAFGADVYDAYKAFLDQAGGTELGHDKVPLGTTDFSGFILKIRQAKPDVVITALSGNELPNLLKQYADLGMADGPPITSPIVADTDLVAAGQQASGIYGKLWHHDDPNNSPSDRAFAADYKKKYGHPPAGNAFLGAVSMRLMLAGIEKAGSLDASAIVSGLEQARLPEGDLPVYFREWDHQLMHRFLLLQVRKSVTDPYEALEVIRSVPGTADGLEALYGEQAASACKLESV